MPRKLTKGPAITLRLHLEADQHARSEAERLDQPVGRYVADRYEATFTSQPAPEPLAPVQTAQEPAKAAPKAAKPAQTAPDECPAGGKHVPKGTNAAGQRTCRDCGMALQKDGSWKA